MTDKKENKIEVIQVAKEVENRIQTPDGEVMTQEEYLAWLGNKILKIEKAVC